MKIAILAWGSLVWDPRNLPIVGEAQKHGPTLRIEFSRISKNKRLTLVIDDQNGVEVETRYFISADTELGEAITHLKQREETTTEHIGFVDLVTGKISESAQASHSTAIETIRVWGKKHAFDAVIWTALPPKFETVVGKPFSPDTAIAYLATLTDQERATAQEYIEKAPPEVDTPVRRLAAPHVASPISTGGAGTVLEHRFAASCVALMLCRGELPFFPGSTIDEVSVQAGSLGWRTDDVLVGGSFTDGSRFALAAQAKRNCAPIESDTDFVGFITESWTDFISPHRFKKGSDRLVLVSSFQSSKLTRFRQLIEQAQATTNAKEWVRKLKIPKFLSHEVAEVKTTIGAILKKACSKDISDDELWEFLRHCGVVFTDLDSEGSLHEAQLLSLLRTTCADGDPVSGAANTWAELFKITAFEEGKAKTFRLVDLPQTLKSRHATARAVDQKLLGDLARDTKTVLARSRDTIQGAAIERIQLEATISTALNTHRVVLVTGGAGSGKSAVAKHVFAQAWSGAFAVAFNAEEFAAANLRSSPAMHGVDLGKFAEISALYPKRLVLVESVERLLEDSRRDAFLDFLRQVAADPSWHVLLTCRSSASTTVELAFLGEAGLKGLIVDVPPLSDAELSEISAKLPQLQRPLSSPKLKELLRQPFVLEKAAALAWPTTEPLPTIEKQFRAKVWAEIVRKNSITTNGLPQRRADTFIAIALQRSKELVAYVRASGFDANAVQQLRSDDLIIVSQRAESLIAPAHDMLEDWALLQWLDEIFIAKEDQLLPLVESLELFPALRRAYRKWLAEWIEADPVAAGPQILNVVRSGGLPQQWRDETIATIMRSSHAAAFVTANASALLENDGDLLFRCVHLCRVAATTRASHASISLGRLSLGRMPSGAGWVALAELIHANLGLVTSNRIPLVSKFIEDWTKTVTATNPYPPGSKACAEIALAQLEKFDGYRTSASEHRLAQSVLKIPLAAKDELIRQIREGFGEHRFNRDGEGLIELVLSYHHSFQLCRDIPDIVIECLNAYLCADEDHDNDLHRMSGRAEVERVFGLRPFLELHSSSSSALSGPFLNLLLFHPNKALTLIVSILNRGADAFAKNAPNAEFIEPPSTIEIELADGTKKRVFSSGRLWGMYRAATVAPHVLESALMALESWLLLIGEGKPETLPTYLTQIVGSTNNVALLAVVASVATAFPYASGDAAFAVISHRDLFHLDLERFVQESAALEDLFGGTSIDAYQKMEKEERRASRKRPHRKESVEDLCRKLQLTPLRERVWGVLDRYRAEAGGDTPSDTGAAVWLNIVHRIDLRTFEHVKTEAGRNFFAPRALPEAVSEKIAPHRPALDTNQTAMTLLNWGMAAFEGKLKFDATSQWRDMLTKARTAKIENDDHVVTNGGFGYIAAITVRDHWDELDHAERDWCIGTIGAEVMKEFATESEFLASQNHPMNGDRPAAISVARIHAKLPGEEDVRELLSCALTHAVEQVRQYAAVGFEREFSKSEPALFLHVLRCFSEGALHYKSLHVAEQEIEWNQRTKGIELQQKALNHTQKLILEKPPLTDDTLLKLRIDDSGADLFTTTIANWLTLLPEDSAAGQFFERNTNILIEVWTDREDQHQRHSSVVGAFEKALARYLLRSPIATAEALAKKAAGAIPKAADEVGMFIWDLILEADRSGEVERFWKLWPFFRNETIALPGHQIQRRQLQIVRKLFLDLEGSGDDDFPLLQKREQEIVGLYRSLPTWEFVTVLFLRYLKLHGQGALPAAFIEIAKKIKDDPSESHLSENAVFLLEQLLSARVFATPLNLKQNPDIRAAVLAILDALVNVGSAAAFIMRDDFATPLPATK